MAYFQEELLNKWKFNRKGFLKMTEKWQMLLTLMRTWKVFLVGHKKNQYSSTSQNLTMKKYPLKATNKFISKIKNKKLYKENNVSH